MCGNDFRMSRRHITAEWSVQIMASCRDTVLVGRAGVPRTNDGRVRFRCPSRWSNILPLNAPRRNAQFPGDPAITLILLGGSGTSPPPTCFRKMRLERTNGCTLTAEGLPPLT